MPKFTVNDIIKLAKKRRRNKYSPVTTPIYKFSASKGFHFRKESNELYRNKVVTTPWELRTNSPLDISKISLNKEKQNNKENALAIYMKFDQSAGRSSVR